MKDARLPSRTGRGARIMGRLWAVAAVTLAVCGCGNTSSSHPKTTPIPEPAVAQECAPKTCADLHATCGQVDDGCGHPLTCGSCGPDQECVASAGGQSCGPSSCVPATCAQLGATCGVANDGCGGTLQCGGCSNGESCGGGGVPNSCGAPSGTVRWGQIFNVNGTPRLGVVPGGSSAVVTIGGADTAVHIFRAPLDGSAPTTLRSGTVTSPADTLTTSSPSGDLFLLPRLSCTGTTCASGDFGGGGVSGPFVVKRSPNDAFAWQRPLGSVTALALAVDATGEAAALIGVSDTQRQLVKLAADGTVAWVTSTAAQAVAFDARGYVLLAGRATGSGAVTPSPSDWQIADGLVVAKLGPDGHPGWQRAFLGCVGQFSAISANARMIVTAAVISGDCTIAGTQLRFSATAPQPVAIALDQSGNPVWARSLNLSATGGPVMMALQGSGQSAFATAQGGFQVLGPDGSALSARILPGTPTAMDANPNGDWLVAGTSSGTIDLGSSQSPSTAQPRAYLIDLRP